jgi:hypothetical protein
MASGSISRTAALAMLGLADSCSQREITAAYRRLARSTHPDITGVPDHDAADRFTALTDAYHVLTSPSGSPAPEAPPSSAVRSRPPGQVLGEIRLSRPPIVAGPVRIQPLPPQRRGSA